ncbi:MAG: hypothetical protein K2H66_05695, partial [Oscillospiraceae bacterium]|nr:hypothetical protein [Oscillospiraceae bacterium]
MNYFLETIGKKFHLSGNLLDSKLLTNGGIHDSYQVIYLNPDFTKKYYIFQKMNRIAFQNPEIMMQNIAVVANHLKNNYP